MTPAFSAYLNGLRFMAALVVLVGHWSYRMPEWSITRWIYVHDIARDAVIVFFVMSGLVIAYSTERKSKFGLGRFAADRCGRLWSVAIPAMVLTIGIDSVFHWLGTTNVPLGPSDAAGWASMSAIALAFFNQLWWLNLDIASNTPWWSLGYEAWYYAIFAAWFFLRGRARLYSTVGLSLIAGPKILLLAPAWVAGVYVWHLISTGQHRRLEQRSALVGIIATALIYGVAQGFALPSLMSSATEATLGVEAYQMLARSGPFVWLNILGALTAFHILCVASVCADDRSKDGLLRRTTHWFADATFSLYLVHMPVMWLVGALLPAETHILTRAAALLLIPFAASLAFAEVFERNDWGLRAMLRRLMVFPVRLIQRLRSGILPFPQ
ncbi:MAG: acyltransferase [Pseudomonadota bacterium]